MTQNPEAAFLRRYRKTHGLTQDELAVIMQTEQSHISNIERGKRRMSWKLAQRCARQLSDCSVQHLRPDIFGEPSAAAETTPGEAAPTGA